MAEEAKYHVNRLRTMAKTHGLCLIAEPDLTTIADIIEQLSSELEQVKRERDAAINELKDAVEACEYCKKFAKRSFCSELENCDECCGWEWRGPCAENGGADNGV